MFKFIKKIFILILIIIILVCSFITYEGYSMYKEVISKESIEKKVEKIKEYDNYISISEVPETYKNATIAIEDHRFYSHGAIDVFTTARSFIENIRKKEWFTLIDCSYKLSYIINELNQGHSISSILDGEANIIEKLKDVNIWN